MALSLTNWTKILDKQDTLQNVSDKLDVAMTATDECISQTNTNVSDISALKSDTNVISDAQFINLALGINTDTLTGYGYYQIDNTYPTSLPSNVGANLELNVYHYINDTTTPNKIMQIVADLDSGLKYSRTADDYTNPVWSAWTARIV